MAMLSPSSTRHMTRRQDAEAPEVVARRAAYRRTGQGSGRDPARVAGYLRIAHPPACLAACLDTARPGRIPQFSADSVSGPLRNCAIGTRSIS